MKSPRPKIPFVTWKGGEQPSDDYVPLLISEGQYDVQCIGFNTSVYLGRSNKIFLYFSFALSGREDVTLFKVMNFGYDPLPKASEYYRSWLMCYGQRPRSCRRNQMKPDIFLNKPMTVRVKTVIPTFKDGKPRPEYFHYSKVDEILRVGT